jgi:stearoyl-CoA desaturase (delta-9 desaturase)
MVWLIALGAVAVTVQLSTYATTIYLHRCLTHRGLYLHPIAAFPMRLQLWWATGIVPKEWVAVHRKHHRYTDVEGDPHSPVLKGLWKILLGNAFYYARETRNKETLSSFAPDIGNGWLDRYLFRFGGTGLIFGTLFFMAVFWLLSGSLFWGFMIGGVAFLVQAVLYILNNSLINGAGHAIGYKNFDNTATNMWFIALITGGEGLHNNHHEYPTSACFSVKRSEIDLGWPVIKVLSWIKLARPLHTAPKLNPQ